MQRFARWSGGILIVALLLLLFSAFWLVATQSGARWLLAQASPQLPGALRIGDVHGAVIRGLSFRAISWIDETVRANVAEADIEVELLPLLKRELRINRLNVRTVDLAIDDSPTHETDTGAFTIDLPITLRVDDAFIENTRVSGGGNEIAIDTIRLDGQLAGPDLKIDRLELDSALGDLGLSGTARLAGNYPVKASAGWALRLPDQPALSGSLNAEGNSSGYRIEHDLDAPYEIATRGTIALLENDVRLDLENSWEQLRIEAGSVPVIDATKGMLRVAGTTARLDFDAATMLSSVDFPDVQLRTNGTLGDKRIEFGSLSVSNEWGKLLADGVFVISDEPHWSFNMGLSELDPALADARLTGAIEIVATTTGRLADRQPAIALSIERLSGNVNGHPLDGSGRLAYSSERLQFDNAVVSIGDNRLTLAGSYGPQLQVEANARFSNLRQFGLGIGGALNGDVRFAAESDAFSASGDVDGENLAWGEYRIDTLGTEFDLPATGKGTASLRVESTEEGSVSVEIDGRFDEEQWSGEITDFTARRAPVGEWTLREATGFSLSRSGFSLPGACLRSASTAGEICVALDYDATGPLSFETTVKALPVAALPRNLPEGATVLGNLSAEMRGEFANGQLNSSATASIDGLGLLAAYEDDRASARFESASASATVVDNRLTGEFDFRLEDGANHASGTIDIDDLFDRQSPLSGNGRLEVDDLTLFSFFVPDIANPLGNINGRIDVAGDLSAPEFSGEIRLHDGSVDIRRAGISVTEIGLLLRQSQAGELALTGSAKSGEGYLRISGETVVGTGSGMRSEIRLDGEDFSLLRLPDWQLTASPSVVVLLDDRETRINGELGIPQASIVIQTVPESAQKPSADVVVHRGEASYPLPQRMLYVDLTTDLGEAVTFSGFGLTTGLEGSVRISGDSASPYKSQGRLVLREGRYEAYGQNLEIDSGELVFNGPLDNPALNVRATRTASDKTVAGIHLTGTPAQLRSEVYSAPPLGDAEALSYLLTGRPLNAANSEEGDMLNQAAFALGLTTAGNVVSRIQNELGLDTLGFQGGAENRQLVAGKQLNSRLFVEYAYGVVDNLGTLLLRYQLSRRLMVESRSGAVRIVDVVYSVKKP